MWYINIVWLYIYFYQSSTMRSITSTFDYIYVLIKKFRIAHLPCWPSLVSQKPFIKLSRNLDNWFGLPRTSLLQSLGSTIAGKNVALFVMKTFMMSSD